MKLWSLSRVLSLGFGLLLLTLIALVHIHQISLAQSGPIILTKTLNKTSPVVRVGEVLSFTISLTNNAGFTLTNVTLVDNYNQGVLGFAGAIPAQDLHNAATGGITWTNVANSPIPPGQTLTFTVFFTAEHPQTSVVNFVKAQDITGTMGAISDTEDTDQVDEAIGGNAPIFKAISSITGTPQAGSLVTFTHIITNDGAALMTFLPLTDTYDAAFLEFNFAIPTPTITSPPGLLVWNDLTTHFGDLAPFQTIVVTTVFTATAQVNNTVNQASTQGAQDEYGNDLTGGEALVPITIIDNEPTPTPNPTATPTPTPSPFIPDDSSDNDDDDDGGNDIPAPAPTATPSSFNEPTPTAVPLATNTPIATVVASQETISNSQTIVSLPETGYPPPRPSNLPFLSLMAVIALAGLLLGWYLLGTKQSKR